ncbi:hypothetical protein [Pseudomonas sp. EA_5y_Pfl2_R50]|uniref:hypothetical protein n=1 Tax=Pseudomonas sp. EA_5y_Pfl2_R50 TaxID=3088691 RepID=UPI0030D84B08
MQAFICDKTVVDFGDFSGSMVRREQSTTPAGAQQSRYWVRTADGDVPLDLFNKSLLVNKGDRISVLYGQLPGGELRSAVCVFNHSDSRLTVLSDGKALYGELLRRSPSPVPFLLCITTSTIAAGLFDWWGAPAGAVVYFLLKAQEAKRKMLLINGLGSHMAKLGERYVREDSRRNVSRLLARTA